MFRTTSSAANMDEDGSPNIQQTRAENPSSVAASLRLLAELNALEAEEMKCRHEERAKQIQEEMDDKNMERNNSNYTPMRKAYFDRKQKRNYEPTAVVSSNYTPTMADDEDDVDYGY
ncbi:hypothetical protein D8674_012798 [Pyrus ussuriensis x Pyrus communis]|uniref:Uncharacterized protein n=1 Tax=Pyrus ussuriensis x Pyrus communis TaxID=2448454 RepID=A0A5N5GN07_9ROSA|nr:hypothetical protein D8674_012798 [Pyrus ussuriensis x Pyrus communis]